MSDQTPFSLRSVRDQALAELGGAIKRLDVRLMRELTLTVGVLTDKIKHEESV